MGWVQITFYIFVNLKMVNATVVKTKIYLRICLQIYSLFFTAAAGALLKEVTGQAWLQAMVSGIAAIQRYTY